MNIDHETVARMAGQLGKTGADRVTDSPKFMWDSMDVVSLVKHRDDIVAALRRKVPLSLQDMSVEEELITQFQLIRQLQTETLSDEDTPTNQKAQVANTLGVLISKVADLQLSIYTSERTKRIENAVIRFIRGLPEDQQALMLEQYETAVRQEQE